MLANMSGSFRLDPGWILMALISESLVTICAFFESFSNESMEVSLKGFGVFAFLEKLLFGFFDPVGFGMFIN